MVELFLDFLFTFRVVGHTLSLVHGLVREVLVLEVALRLGFTNTWLVQVLFCHAGTSLLLQVSGVLQMSNGVLK